MCRRSGAQAPAPVSTPASLSQRLPARRTRHRPDKEKATEVAFALGGTP